MPSLLMPNVGEGVTQGTVVRWLKHEGDHVRLDEPLVEVETDKAVVEVPSPYHGVLARILVPNGAIAKIGAPLAEIDAAPARHPLGRGCCSCPLGSIGAAGRGRTRAVSRGRSPRARSGY